MSYGPVMIVDCDTDEWWRTRDGQWILMDDLYHYLAGFIRPVDFEEFCYKRGHRTIDQIKDRWGPLLTERYPDFVISEVPW